MDINKLKEEENIVKDKEPVLGPDSSYAPYYRELPDGTYRIDYQWWDGTCYRLAYRTSDDGLNWSACKFYTTEIVSNKGQE